MAKVNIGYKSKVNFYLQNDHINRVVVHYQMNTSESWCYPPSEVLWPERKLYKRYEQSWLTPASKNWYSQSIEEIYQWSYKPLYELDAVPTFLNDLNSGSFSSSISISTSSFSQQDWCDDNENSQNQYPALPTPNFSGNYIFSFDSKYEPIIKAEE